MTIFGDIIQDGQVKTRPLKQDRLMKAIVQKRLENQKISRINRKEISLEKSKAEGSKKEK